MKKAIKVEINGEPYKITPNEFGWGVTNLTSRINNIARTYQVFASKVTGQPERCSCPHQTRKGAHCKHMAEIARQLRAAESEGAEISSHSLEHPAKPRLYRFGVMRNSGPAVGLVVRYERWEGAVMTSSQILTIEEARERWTWLRRSGYSPFGYISREEGR